LLKASAIAVLCCALSGAAAAQLGEISQASPPSRSLVLPAVLPVYAARFSPPESASAKSDSSAAESGGLSSRLAWEAGTGFTQPNGNASTLLDPGWNVRVGGGWKFSRQLSVLAEYEFDRFNWESPPLAGGGSRANGTMHLWSVVVEPVWRHRFTTHFGGYAEGGGGFYRLTTNYGNTVPGFDCNPLFGCFPEPPDSDPSRVTSNQGGVNGGIGFTYQTSSTSRWCYYTEVRFTWLDTHPETAAFFPVSFGVRW